MSPTLIFDKSFLQSLSLDEAIVLDHLFACLVTPLFFVETLGDIAKEPGRTPSPSSTVRLLAEKTPITRSYINAFHQDIVIEELLGERCSLDYRPRLANGVPVEVEGRNGVVFQKSRESEAFERWQQEQFSEVEKQFATHWRRMVANADLSSIADFFRKLLKEDQRPKSLPAARNLARSIVDTPGQNYRILGFALAVLNVPTSLYGDIIRKWKQAGSPTIRAYAPFTAYCFEIEMLFYLALSNGLISDQRGSNRVDISYLCYLPFARIFVSNDRLHRSTVPLVATDQQVFVWGPDLKADLAKLNAHFSSLPMEERTQGLFKLADRPPVDHGGLIGSLWDRFAGAWRNAQPKPSAISDPAIGQSIIERSNRLIDAARSGTARGATSRRPDHLLIERSIPVQRGSWRIFPPGVETETRNSRSDSRRS